MMSASSDRCSSARSSYLTLRRSPSSSVWAALLVCAATLLSPGHSFADGPGGLYDQSPETIIRFMIDKGLIDEGKVGKEAISEYLRLHPHATSLPRGVEASFGHPTPDLPSLRRTLLFYK